jgi:hypothetical protein
MTVQMFIQDKKYCTYSSHSVFEDYKNTNQNYQLHLSSLAFLPRGDLSNTFMTL